MEAFPEKERHELAIQRRMLDEPNYHYDIYSHSGQLVGIMLWWELPAWCYLAHFASAEALRNQGFGSKMLQDYIGRQQKQIILEVEIPMDPLDHRRIGFYRRNGFILNDHPYQIPAMGKSPALPFHLMTYPEVLSDSELSEFEKQLFPILQKFC